ncbi:unnamed protein product [Prorocentrum cordatum]|uniref:Uncharacterized protein n=1 Tax=Prorocentrum cordatum TaxID=2364126 RepID=A0ABN9UV69_9DINO|nr:unnamed protein product [Polarella glacialis]
MLSSIPEAGAARAEELPPPRPHRPPPRPRSRRETLLEAACSGCRAAWELEGCDSIVCFEFSHTASYEPGPANYYLAFVALHLWHGPLRQRRGVPILAPPRLARVLRDMQRKWPDAAAPTPRISDLGRRKKAQAPGRPAHHRRPRLRAGHCGRRLPGAAAGRLRPGSARRRSGPGAARGDRHAPPPRAQVDRLAGADAGMQRGVPSTEDGL